MATAVVAPPAPLRRAVTTATTSATPTATATDTSTPTSTATRVAVTPTPVQPTPTFSPTPTPVRVQVQQIVRSARLFWQFLTLLGLALALGVAAVRDQRPKIIRRLARRFDEIIRLEKEDR
ncbi:hypothetical protein SE15_03260 [Thermanaerothrix daxensis]|uniref:Uncharacterized protein n=2 Tax=Thermanaerothrix daxensis TaxID=869279 RepID=A0A0N8GQN5_9CHLR|nr:hypothetical protein SE15_03260 [Thermanaerothrix daxensis]